MQQMLVVLGPASPGERSVRMDAGVLKWTRHRWLLFAILAALLLPGIVGHDPWKQDEGYTFGVVLDILRTGHWIVPTLAGEPFMEKPPLFYLSSAATARVLSPWLPMHDGARVASVLYVGLGLFFVAICARKLFGPGHGAVAALLAAACVGFLPHAHELISDTALFAGFAMAIAGFAFALERPLAAGVLIGTGVGIGFMSKGLVEPAMLGLAALALPCVSREWRHPTYPRSLALAALFAAPWLFIWPTMLYLEDPSAFFTWFWVNNFGRYFGFASLGAETEAWYYTRTLPWFTFPAGPLAIWTLARIEREEARRNIMLLGVIAASMCVVLATAATARALYAIPLLIPLSIMGSVRVRELPVVLARALSAVGLLIGTAVAIVCVALWAYGTTRGHAPHFDWIAERLPTDFNFPFVRSLAVAAFALFCVVAICVTRREAGWLHRWTAGLALAWGMPMTLLLPWIDNARSFREPFAAMVYALPEADCVAIFGLGENQRGMLDYVVALQPAAWKTPDRCNFVLWQRNHADDEAPDVIDGWPLVWEGGRAGESDERFFLYRSRSIDHTALDETLPRPARPKTE